jgi:hypothetical protein
MTITLIVNQMLNISNRLDDHEEKIHNEVRSLNIFNVAVQNIEGQEKQPEKKSSYPLKLKCQITANP